MNGDTDWRELPFWAAFRRVSLPGAPGDELLSVYRDYGVVPRAGRKDNNNRPSEDLSKYQLVEVGDLVINKMKAWQGSLAVSNHRGIISPAYFVYEPSGAINGRFAHYLVRSVPFVAALRARSKGIRPAQWDLDPDAARTLALHVPPTRLQEAIADYLDRETVEIDAFIADQEELIALLEERRRAEIDSAVLRERLRLVEVRRLGTRMQSGTSVNGESSPIEPGEVGVLRTGAASKGHLDLSENKRVVPEDVSRVSCPLRIGTLLVNRANTADLVASSVFVDRSDPGLYLSDKLWQIEFEKASSEFMALWAQTTDYRQQVKLRCVGSSSTMQNLAYESYLNLRVPLYTLERQGEIVQAVKGEVAELNAAIADAREAIALSKERRAALISAAVIGQIDVTENEPVLV